MQLSWEHEESMEEDMLVSVFSITHICISGFQALLVTSSYSVIVYKDVALLYYSVHHTNSRIPHLRLQSFWGFVLFCFVWREWGGMGGWQKGNWGEERNTARNLALALNYYPKTTKETKIAFFDIVLMKETPVSPKDS